MVLGEPKFGENITYPKGYLGIWVYIPVFSAIIQRGTTFVTTSLLPWGQLIKQRVCSDRENSFLL